MLCFVHEGYKLLGMHKPELNLPVQLVGMLVADVRAGLLAGGLRSSDQPQRLAVGLAHQAAGAAAGNIVCGDRQAAPDLHLRAAGQ